MARSLKSIANPHYRAAQLTARTINEQSGAGQKWRARASAGSCCLPLHVWEALPEAQQKMIREIAAAHANQYGVDHSHGKAEHVLLATRRYLRFPQHVITFSKKIN